MGTYFGLIVERGDRDDFDAVLTAHRIERVDRTARSHVLVDCQSDGAAPPRLARELARTLGRPCIALVAQTTASVQCVERFDAGVAVRTLAYIEYAWSRVEGPPQPWELALLFDDAPSAGVDAGQRWPSDLSDELPDADIARYRAARAAGEPWRVLDLLPGVTVRYMGRPPSSLIALLAPRARPRPRRARRRCPEPRARPSRASARETSRAARTRSGTSPSRRQRSE